MAAKRESIAPNGDKRYVRRDRRGRFTTDQMNVGRSPRTGAAEARGLPFGSYGAS